MLDVLVGLVHAVKAPLMIPVLRWPSANMHGSSAALASRGILWSHLPVWKSPVQDLRTLCSRVGFGAAVNCWRSHVCQCSWWQKLMLCKCHKKGKVPPYNITLGLERTHLAGCYPKPMRRGWCPRWRQHRVLCCSASQLFHLAPLLTFCSRWISA